jgi:hypothetical protein
VGEIKSTLDLVLEKTRHLTLSDEEKQRQQKEEALKTLNGVLHKYFEGQIQLGRLQQELQRLTAASPALDTRLIADHVLNQIQTDADNTPWLAYLETVASEAVIRIEQVLADHADILNREAQQRQKQMLDDLGEKYLISGSAVIPNLPADKAWQQRRAAIHAKYDRLLQEAKHAFIVSLEE